MNQACGIVSVAKMTTERHAAEYNMKHKQRGMALIFNHEHFDVPTLKSRAGTNVDCDNLTRVLKQLDFEVTVYKDCRYKDILRTVEYAASQNHKDNDCILVAILSHGVMGYIYAKDTQYKLDSIWSCFTADRCPTLAGKPKLFFIQACQGKSLGDGITMLRTDHIETDGESATNYRIPNHADFLFAYSTIPGFYAWRNRLQGNWFVQALCAELATNGKRLDILTLLTYVCQRVAIDVESNNLDIPECNQKTQIPCIMTMLTRVLRFSDK
ncbi:uncharacterized protein Dwil_GK11926 [Drosophila willistoni]|uniref:Uncharacterized protein n=1 Tax=Drosophila willistoni TaxID=7260 RepID=B4NBL9_DROWI|nr:caspase [Drosophila willistoni]EDW81183.2 uncharacterized protein Dwil_GK11926 [Drosophila willistoni]